MSSELRIGVATEVITPPIGTLMSGFDARKGPAESVHDDLYARAVVIDDGTTAAALVSLDLLGMEGEWGNKIRSAIEDETGIPASHIVLGATHTHCGPAIFVPFYNPAQVIDFAYLDRLAAKIIAVTVAAFRSRAVRRLRSGYVPVEGIAVNRRTPDGRPIDETAGVMVVEEFSGTPVAVLVSYSCHTTVLGPDTVAFSADYPYYTGLELKEKLGADVELLFFNGTEGDISVGHKSDLSAVGIIAPFRTFEKAEELGRRLGAAVLAGLPSLVEEDGPVVTERRVVAMPLKKYAPAQEMHSRREQAIAHVAELEADGKASPEALIAARQQRLFTRIEAHYADLWEAIPQNESAKTLDTEVVAVGIGKTCWISYPGEVFVEIGLDVRKRSPFARTYFIGLANHYLGYFPTAGANANLGYEVVAARVTPEAAEVLARGSASILRAAFEKIGSESKVN